MAPSSRTPGSCAVLLVALLGVLPWSCKKQPPVTSQVRDAEPPSACSEETQAQTASQLADLYQQVGALQQRIDAASGDDDDDDSLGTASGTGTGSGAAVASASPAGAVDPSVGTDQSSDGSLALTRSKGLGLIDDVDALAVQLAPILTQIDTLVDKQEACQADASDTRSADFDGCTAGLDPATAAGVDGKGLALANTPPTPSAGGSAKPTAGKTPGLATTGAGSAGKTPGLGSVGGGAGKTPGLGGKTPTTGGTGAVCKTPGLGSGGSAKTPGLGKTPTTGGLAKTPSSGGAATTPRRLDQVFGRPQPPAYVKDHEKAGDGTVVPNPGLQVAGAGTPLRVDPKKEQIWAIRADGKLVIGDETVVGHDAAAGRDLKLGHPTLTGGGEARIAGEIRWVEGRPVINNKSGRFSNHGDRGPDQLDAAVQIFKAAGLDVTAQYIQLPNAPKPN